MSDPTPGGAGMPDPGIPEPGIPGGDETVRVPAQPEVAWNDSNDNMRLQEEFVSAIVDD